MSGTRRELVAGVLFTSPWLIGSLTFMFLPMALSLYYSFTDYPLLEPPLYVGVDNYTRMLGDEAFIRAVTNTSVFAAVSIPLTTILALVLSAALNSRSLGRMRKAYQVAVFVPTLVPLVASAMVWSWLFNGENGLVNRLLALVGISGPNWLVAPAWAMPALVVMTLWGVGQAVVIYIAAMQDVPKSLYEAAELDGMGPARRFVNVTLPMLSPVIMFNVVVLTINTLQIFAAPYIMFRTKDGHNPAGLHYAMYLYDNAFVYLQMGYASAMAWVLLIVTLALTGALFLVSRRLVYYHA